MVEKSVLSFNLYSFLSNYRSIYLATKEPYTSFEHHQLTEFITGPRKTQESSGNALTLCCIYFDLFSEHTRFAQ